MELLLVNDRQSRCRSTLRRVLARFGRSLITTVRAHPETEDKGERERESAQAESASKEQTGTKVRIDTVYDPRSRIAEVRTTSVMA
jgi:hypothetical protein